MDGLTSGESLDFLPERCYSTIDRNACKIATASVKLLITARPKLVAYRAGFFMLISLKMPIDATLLHNRVCRMAGFYL